MTGPVFLSRWSMRLSPMSVLYSPICRRTASMLEEYMAACEDTSRAVQVTSRLGVGAAAAATRGRCTSDMVRQWWSRRSQPRLGEIIQSYD